MRYRVGRNLWEPLAIALLVAIPNRYSYLVPCTRCHGLKRYGQCSLFC
jgi:hypothetical protein